MYGPIVEKSWNQPVQLKHFRWVINHMNPFNDALGLPCLVFLCNCLVLQLMTTRYNTRTHSMIMTQKTFKNTLYFDFYRLKALHSIGHYFFHFITADIYSQWHFTELADLAFVYFKFQTISCVD